MKIVFAFFIAVLVAGCGCHLDHVELDSSWDPFKRVQRAEGVPEGMWQPKGNIILGDPCEFGRLSSVQREGVRVHEIIHGQAQREMGLAEFEKRYANDIGFRAAQERAGWHAQIASVVRHGEEIDPELVARAFLSYRVGVYEDNLAWAQSEIQAARSK